MIKAIVKPIDVSFTSSHNQQQRHDKLQVQLW
jgi:hypothetical protein